MNTSGLSQFAAKLSPKQILVVLNEIDTAAPSYSASREESLRKVTIVMMTVGLCLLLIHYMKYSSTMMATLQMASSWLGEQPHYLKRQIQASGFAHLISYAWWTSWHIVGYLLIPAIIIKWLLKEKVVGFGWRWNETHQHWAGYALLITPILFFIFLVSFRDDFLNHYPFYKQAGRSWFDLISWEVLYLIQFITLEFFFRGFFVQALRPSMGANAIWVMCIPYLMIHFPKLWPEAFGALLFGLFLGILALRSRSIWGGFLVHAGIAITMDIASLVRQDKLPTVWWPF